MTVRSYLRFVCELKEVARKAITAHVDEIMGICGLTEVAGRLIGHLSKGYRQRVGIAQALCGDPPVLVLDEPTVGLDPRQVVEIRALIKQLGQTHTVIFSSHLLSEIQQLCQRVIILHRGKMIREADMAELTGTGDALMLRASIKGRQQELLPALLSLPCVRRVKPLKQSAPGITEVSIECELDSSPDAQTAIFRLLCAMDAPIMQLVTEQDTLEDAFLRATSQE
jgi:ABC-2 type transport system ATP-binding protein